MALLKHCLITFLLTVSLVIVAADFQIKPDIPVPATPHGMRYQPADPRPKVMLEMFLEVHCSDSEHGWGIIKSVQQHYGTDKLDVVVQPFPLPYHRNAFLGTQGMYLIQQSSRRVSDKMFAYLEESMKMAWTFATNATVNLTETQVLDMMADMATRVTGIDKTYFISNINNYIATTRGAWKFGAKRGVAVTPTFFVNGVELGIGTSVPTYDDWITFLNPIIGV